MSPARARSIENVDSGSDRSLRFPNIDPGSTESHPGYWDTPREVIMGVRQAFRGLYPATVTPFSEDWSIDFAALENHFYTTCEPDGVSGIVVNGHIGEVLTLSTAERQEIVACAVGCRREGQLVVAGIEGRTPSEGVREGIAAREAGADALLVLPPFDVRPYRKLVTDVGAMTHYFGQLDEHVGLPVIIFQYPRNSLCWYPVEVLTALAEIDCVSGIKVAAEDVNGYAEVYEALGDRLSILAASDSPPLLGMLLYGGSGALIGISVIGTKHWANLISSALDGRVADARDLFMKVSVPLMDAVFENQRGHSAVSDAATTKEALVQLGQIPSSRVRSPAIGVDAARAEQIGQALRSSGLM